MEELRPHSEHALRRMAEELVNLPEAQSLTPPSKVRFPKKRWQKSNVFEGVFRQNGLLREASSFGAIEFTLRFWRKEASSSPGSPRVPRRMFP